MVGFLGFLCLLGPGPDQDRNQTAISGLCIL